MDIASVSLGVSFAALAVATAAIFKKPKDTYAPQRRQNKIVTPWKTTKAKGFIVEPESEADSARQSLIEKNRQLGKDTPLTDLEYEDT